MNRRLRNLYWWLERRLNPGAESSQYVYERSLRERVSRRTIWLDAGCGNTVMPLWIGGQLDLINSARMVLGMDPLFSALKENKQIPSLVAGKLENLPFSDESVNLVSANMVMEHVEDPVRALSEIQRVLMPGGVFIFHTPNKKHYLVLVASLLPQWFKAIVVRSTESRTPFKTFYRVNTTEQIARLSNAAGFVVDELRCTDTSSVSGIYFGPLLIPMLLYSSLLRWGRLRKYRSNLVVVLRKPQVTERERCLELEKELEERKPREKPRETAWSTL